MQETLAGIVGTINSVLWDYVLIFALCGLGLFFTIYLGAPQFTKIGIGFKSLLKPQKNTQHKGKSVSQFQALTVAVAAQVGTGNVVGIATAIVAGGPGAVFWLWVSALLGMATIFGEAVLAQKYRVQHQGNYIGGPAFYITLGLKKILGEKTSRYLAYFFSVAIIIALGFIGNAVQANSIAGAVNLAFGINELAIGIILAIVAGLIFIGGIHRIANFAQFVVPFMALAYILCAIWILFQYSEHIGTIMHHIWTAAFSSEAMMGGAAGIGIREAMRYGIARGLFSNEAGMGSTPHAHATAQVAHPALQGLAAIIGVANVLLICTASALIILATDAHLLGLKGAAVTQQAFSIAFGDIGAGLLAICLTFFAFTTIVGWYYFGESNIRFLFKNKYLNIYRSLVLIAIILGTLGKVDLVWSLSDMFNGFMVIPNLIALFLLRKEIKAIYVDFQQKIKSKQTLYYDYEERNSAE